MTPNPEHTRRRQAAARARAADAVPGRAELDALLRPHRQHVCPDHPAPGICPACQARWPCDVRLIANAVGAGRHAGSLITAGSRVADEVTAYLGGAHADAAALVVAVGRMKEVLHAARRAGPCECA